MSKDRSAATSRAASNESIVSAVRTALGDAVRSVNYFIPSTVDVLYVR